jgi:hypothetical protein
MSQFSTRAFLVVCAVIFGFIAVVHLTRGVNRWALVIGPLTIPLWESWIAAVVTAAMCLWAIRLVIA